MPAIRIPTEIKKSRGTFRPDRAVEREPEYEPHDEYPAPAHFTGAALTAWHRLSSILNVARVLTAADLVALEQYCVTYSNFRKAQLEVDNRGVLLCSEKGEYKKNPAITAVTEASRELRGLSAMLGLDPASRTKVDGNPPPQSSRLDSWDALLPMSKEPPLQIIERIRQSRKDV
jgi:P27 family predicted phage terminase small subunit